MMYQVSQGGSTSVNVWDPPQAPFASNTANAFNFTATCPNATSANYTGITSSIPVISNPYAKKGTVWIGTGSISDTGTIPAHPSGYSVVYTSKGGLVPVKPGHPTPVILHNLVEDVDPDAPAERVQNRRMFR